MIIKFVLSFNRRKTKHKKTVIHKNYIKNRTLPSICYYIFSALWSSLALFAVSMSQALPFTVGDPALTARRKHYNTNLAAHIFTQIKVLRLSLNS